MKMTAIFPNNTTYCKIDDTTGHSKLELVAEVARLSRYIIRSHQAGIRFFSPESYPGKIVKSSKSCYQETNENRKNTIKVNVNPLPLLIDSNVNAINQIAHIVNAEILTYKCY